MKEKKSNFSFRDTASFGKRIEHWFMGKMLMEGLDVYVPMVDDHGVDLVIKKSNGKFIEVQIKARSNKVAFGDAHYSVLTTMKKLKIFILYFILREWILCGL